MSVDFRILGPLEIVVGDELATAPAGRAQRALLLYLLLHANEVVSVDRLIEALWPSERPATAPKMVQLYVSQLRKTVGDRLSTRPPGYLLELRAGELDAERAAALAAAARHLPAEQALPMLAEALALWRGESLVDVRYEGFAQPDVTRLDELRLALVEHRIDALLASGRDAELVPELQGLVAQHPLRERLRAQLMTALYRSGRQSDALDEYTEARRVLLDELGLAPGNELQELQRMILEHSPALAAPHTLSERVLARPRLLASAGAVLLCAAAAAAVIEIVSSPARRIVVAPNSVVAVDPESGKVVGDIPVGERPSAIAYGFGSIWVANSDSGTVTRIDAKTKRVLATIGDGGDVSDLALGFGAVWVADGNSGTLTRLDPQSNTVGDTIRFGSSDPLRPKPVFNVAVGAGSVWVTREPGVLRIDPSTTRVTGTLRTRPATGIAVGGGRLWVTDTFERIERFDLARLGRTGTIATPSVATAPLLAGNRLWAIVSNYQLWNIDPDALTVFGTTPTGDGASDVVWRRGRLWVANSEGRTVVRVEPGSLRIDRSIPFRAPPAALVFSPDLLWVAVAAAT
jgi:YVTN family beta-propeller protein